MSYHSYPMFYSVYFEYNNIVCLSLLTVDTLKLKPNLLKVQQQLTVFRNKIQKIQKLNVK